MQKDEAAARLARQVSDALVEMLENSPSCPRDADPFDWSSDVLDELARAIGTISQVVDRLAGGPEDDDAGSPPADTIEELARELATAIVRQRNSLLADGPPRRRHPGPVPPRPSIAVTPLRS